MDILDQALKSLGLQTIVGLAIAASYVIWTIVGYRRLSHIPGPRWTGISNIPHSLAYASGECHKWYQAASNKHGKTRVSMYQMKNTNQLTFVPTGSLTRVGPKSLITSSPELWARLNAVRSPYTRSEWFYKGCRLETGVDNVFTMTNDKQHEARRKQMASGYAGKENPKLEAEIDSNVSALLSLIRSYRTNPGEPSKRMDLAQKIPMFTLDVISTVGFGTAFGMLAADEDVNGYMASASSGLRINNAIIALGWAVQRFMDLPLVCKLGPHEKDSYGFGKMMGTVFEAVEKRVRRGDTDKRSDMLASFMRHGLSGDALRGEVLEQVVAGSDTTAAALRGTMLLLLTSPRVFARLREEVDDAVRQGRAPRTPDVISKAQADALPYLQAVIREGMRVKVPVLCNFPRDIPPGGETWEVDGDQVFIPGGTDVGYSGYAMHHDKRIYGDDAESFRPERWLEKSPNLTVMTKTNDLIFGHGKWQCLGKSVAMFELGKVIFELVRNFDWTLENPEKAWDAHNYNGLIHIENLWVQVQERS
ncbi:uncharacterized protein PpBr36_10754 [Pyricularia pennisetigena]|uniref:uncharacterized protein n=1 Tax=Pyricularia pennisetigena TaxID=1578925 RepID=UPI001153B71A|nr:uncharacterized protein PpBr36_10754 [Pyricularia pennisetigena]TLS20886.1 hypothetical protein PpBr36_10754 [Pyricularia pennisetigena]